MAKKSANMFNQPVSGLVMPRFGGLATFMRLPHVPLEEADGIDIGLAGIPWDGGTTNRPGPRHGPRQIRDQSSMVRRMHQTVHIVPYDLANCAADDALDAEGALGFAVTDDAHAGTDDGDRGVARRRGAAIAFLCHFRPAR